MILQSAAMVSQRRLHAPEKRTNELRRNRLRWFFLEGMTAGRPQVCWLARLVSHTLDDGLSLVDSIRPETGR